MSRKDYIIPLIALLCVVLLLINGPISQDQNYHSFGDQRHFFGIPNFLNVVTNLPFAFIALMGLLQVRYAKEKELKIITFTLFTGFVLLTFGSGYYHLWPANATLVFDRIPMCIIFMSFFSLIIYDRISQRAGLNAFVILNIIGLFSIVCWVLTERAGNGDLRLYGMVQFFPIVAIPLVLILYKASFNHGAQVIPIFLFFGLAKLAEKFDSQIYNAAGNIISGHSIKHLFMAAAEYEIVVMIRRRLKSGNRVRNSNLPS